MKNMFVYWFLLEIIDNYLKKTKKTDLGSWDVIATVGRTVSDMVLLEGCRERQSASHLRVLFVDITL